MITKVKKFFNIKEKYVFDYNDIRCAITLVNVILIMIFGLSVAYVGLAIAVFGTVRDLTIEERRINSTIMHATGILLNCYFVSLLFK